MDLNADLAEKQELWHSDQQLFDVITSANLCSGFYAGSTELIRVAIQYAVKKKVRLGVHFGYPDREHFGRREFPLTATFQESTYYECLFQVGAIVEFARHLNATIAYAKPHGALYNQVMANSDFGMAIVKTCEKYDLPLMVLAGSPLAMKLDGRYPIIREGFADRGYRSDGTLIPRGEPNAIITDHEAMAKQIVWLANEKNVESICIHSDTAGAVEHAKLIRGLIGKTL